MSTSATSRNTALPADAQGAEFYERLLSGAAMPVFVCDLKGVARPLSDAAVVLAAAIEGPTERLTDLFPSDVRPAAEAALEQLLRAREPVEFRARVLGEAARREHLVRLTPIFTADGKLQRVAVWLHETGDRVVRPDAAVKGEKLQTLGTVSGAMAHHYNNLLCCIATNVEYAMNMNTMAAMRRALQRTSTAVGRAADLTRQLLAFAQADHRAENYADLVETVLYYFDENEARLRERRVQLQLDWQPGPVKSVPREEVMQVLEHITSNALDAMPQGGMLFVHLEWLPQAWHLTIEDTGPGLSPEVTRRLFEPFFTTRGELAQGDSRRAGMGLAVVYGLVNEMGGTITAASPPGRGARFLMQFPTAEADAGAAAAPGSPNRGG